MFTKLVKYSIVLAYVFINILWLAVGLWPYRFYLKNNVSFDSNESSLRFRKTSFALLESPSLNKIITNNNGSFSLEIVIRPERKAMDYVPSILSIAKGNKDVFMIGEWRNGVIVRYRYKNGSMTELYKNDVFDHLQKTCICVNKEGKTLSLFVNGLLTGKRDIHSDEQELGGNDQLRVIIGNNIMSNSQWQGSLYSVAFYKNILDNSTIQDHFKKLTINNVSYLQSYSSNLLYAHVNEYQSSTNEKEMFKLVIPERIINARHEYLTPPWVDFKADYNYYEDVILNFIAFVILGVLACLSFSFTKASNRQLIFISTINSFLISITIETLQIYLPTRTSQLSDLLLNTLGGYVGGLLFILFYRKIIAIFIKMVHIRKQIEME